MQSFDSVYRKAFETYLRRGVPIEISVKALLAEIKAESNPTTHYTWRSLGDDKVRLSHAVNNGRIFAWDEPPTTGHPGEDYNCRCRAVPYYGDADTLLEDQSIDAVVTVIVETGGRNAGKIITVWRQ